jgi:hypothetical protein
LRRIKLERPESCVLVTSRSGNGDFQSCIEKCSQSCAPVDNAMRACKRSLKTQVSRLLTEQLALSSLLTQQLALSGSLTEQLALSRLLTEQLTSNSLKQPLIIVLALQQDVIINGYMGQQWSRVCEKSSCRLSLRIED